MELQQKKLKKFLEGWRQVLLPMKSILIWEQQWHPCAIFGLVSLIYLLIWFMDLNCLTTLALLGLIINLMDFLVPIVSSTIFGPVSWSTEKDKKFDEMCCDIITIYNKMTTCTKKMFDMRCNNSYLYYVISISVLVIIAWVSVAVSNVLLFYMLSTAVLLSPGIYERVKGFVHIFGISAKYE